MITVRHHILSLILLAACLSVSSAQAEQVVVTDLRSYQAPDNLRLVFDVSGPVEHRLFTLENPKRIVIDIDNARLKQVLPPLSSEATMVNNIRSSPYKKTGLRVVLDLKQAVRPKTFVLGPAGQYGHRLVVDLYDDAQTEPVIVSKSHEPERQEWVIAIDAGHGGEDPGAIGRRYRTKEKDVVLAIARELERLIKAQPDMRPLMVRRSDYYVGLKQRPLIARKAGADIFISIHADAVPGRRASGSSVYALTERGASDRMAKYLEASENAADSLGGVYADSAEYSDPTLKKVLFDLSETASIGFSLDLGADILKELGRIGPVHRKSVGQAGFAVLKSPIGDVPSVLVETAFISNPTEEKKLRSKTYQRAMAKGILNGIKRFFDRKELKPRVRSMQAKQGATATEKPRHHIVRRGESLTSIARKYNIAVDTLRFANNIHGNNLLAGSKLLIP